MKPAEPVKPGDLAMVLSSHTRDGRACFGKVVMAVAWSPWPMSRPDDVVIEADWMPAPDPKYGYWFARQNNLLKISPDDGQFADETERPRKVKA